MAGVETSIRKKYRKFLIYLFVVYIVLSCGFLYFYFYKETPSVINVFYGDEESRNVDVPVELDLNGCKNRGTYIVQGKLLGLIDIKNVTVNVVDKKQVNVSGVPIGIYLQTKGVEVLRLDEIKTANGNVCSPCKNIINQSDYITSLNGKKINSIYELAYLVNKEGKNKIVLGIRRDKKIISVSVKPVSDEQGQYKLGIWTRDDSQGLGTLTYALDDGKFGALGHAISDYDTGKVLEVNNGLLYKANVWGIKKNQPDNVGGFCGNIIYEKVNVLGQIMKNNEQGLYGMLNNPSDSYYKFEKMELGLKQEIKEGPALIRCTIDGIVKDYKINIDDIDLSATDYNRGLIISVTDSELLDKTGGIVQGMSGSPIIQKNKLVGAVTHVFVNDPTKGYGIFVESMMSNN